MTCTYKFQTPQGEVTLTGQPQMKAYLADVGLDELGYKPDGGFPWDNTANRKVFNPTHVVDGVKLQKIGKGLYVDENGKKQKHIYAKPFESNDNIKPSNSRGTTIKGSTVTQVNEWLTKRQRKMVSSGVIKIVQSAFNSPHDSIRDSKIEGIQGYYNRSEDVVIIIADSIPNQSVLQSVLSHEFYHRAESTDKKLKYQLETLDKRLSEIFQLASQDKGTKTEQDAYKRVMNAKINEFKSLIKKEFDDISNKDLKILFSNASKGIGDELLLSSYKEVMLDALEEYRAYLVTAYNENPENFKGTILQWIKDLYHAIRAALIRQGIMPFNITAADLNQLVAYGYREPSRRGGKGNILASTQRLAPNGKPSNLNATQWEQVRTPEFIKWFGDWINDPENASKVVDENGEPKPVFHGSDAEFNTFKKPEINRMAQRSDVGFWFTTGKQETERYGKVVKEVFLNIKNPKSITIRKLDMMAVSEPMAKVIPKLKRGKVDGLSIPEVKEDKMMGEKYTPAEYVVFNANQIKSAIGNTGAFNPKNDDIRYSVSEDINYQYPIAGNTVDGMLVLKDVPNTSSIKSSLNDYDVLPEIREVSFDLFTQMGDLTYSSKTEKERTKKLAEEIAASKEIKPLIVVVDNEGPYILEGGHRFDALREINAKSFPGLVVIDNDSIDESSSIRFSIAEDINTAVGEHFAERKGKQPLGWTAGIFQRNQLIDFVADQLPMLKEYKRLSQEKDNTINQAEQEIAVRYQEMKDKMSAKEMSDLGRVQGMATRLEDFDPEKFTGNMADLEEEERKTLIAYRALSAGAKAAYVKMRDDYKTDLLDKKRALIDRINEFPADQETKSEIIKIIEENFDKHLTKGVYFPLSRNGDIVVTADKLDGNGKPIPKERVVIFAESEMEKDRLMVELKNQGYKNRKSTLKDAYIKSIAVGNAANNIAALATKAIADLRANLENDPNAETLDETARAVIESGDYDKLLDNFNQLLIDALPDSSYRKHFIHRKGTLGYSTDALRTYAGTRTAAAKNIAGLKFNHKITGQLNDAGKAIKAMDEGAEEITDTDALSSVLNELRKREEKLADSSISQASQVLTSLGFMGALGFNVASAAVNMLQVPGVTLPELTGKHGFMAASGAINRAYGLLFNKNVLDKQSGFDLLKNPIMNKPENAPLKRALQRLHDIGKIDLTMTHDAISEGRNPSYSSNAVTRTVGGIAKYSGYLFHVAEALNRQVTGIAAFNLAFKNNGGNFDKALEDTIDVIDRTQFDYSQGNRSRYMIGDTARVLTLFKSYALGISYYIGRNVHNSLKGETPEIRLAARKALVTQMAMTFATSGLFGLPIGSEAFAILGGVAGFKYKGANFAVPGAIGAMLVFQALLAGLGADDEDDVETQFRNWLTDNFDQTTAEFLTKGPARLLPIGDISGRTGLSDIWWRPQNKELEGRDQYQAFANALIGPLGSQIAGLFTATKMYQDGEYSRMVESMSPAFIRNAVAAARIGSEGAKTIKGDPIVDRELSPVELINKAIGFNPKVLANSYDANTAIVKARDRINMKKSHLVNRYIDADANGRLELMRGAIKDFNAEVEPQERITIRSLIKSIRQRRGLDKRTDNGLYLSRKQAYLRKIGRFADEENLTE